jgi:UDP-sugar pyrophosphorylase
VEQLEGLDAAYPGGLAAYVTKAKALLADAAAGANPFEGFTPSVPSGEDLLYGDAEYQAMEALGLKEAAKVGFVLVAGGLGERLGYSGIKVALPVDLASGQTFLAMYADWILALQARARAATGNPALVVPLAIMTSLDTDAQTKALLEASGNFGLNGPGQVCVLCQGQGGAPRTEVNMEQEFTRFLVLAGDGPVPGQGARPCGLGGPPGAGQGGPLEGRDQAPRPRRRPPLDAAVWRGCGVGPAREGVGLFLPGHEPFGRPRPRSHARRLERPVSDPATARGAHGSVPARDARLHEAKTETEARTETSRWG